MHRLLRTAVVRRILTAAASRGKTTVLECRCHPEWLTVAAQGPLLPQISEGRPLMCGARERLLPSRASFSSACLSSGKRDQPQRGETQHVRSFARNRPLKSTEEQRNEPESSAERTALAEDGKDTPSALSEAKDTTMPSQTTASHAQIASVVNHTALIITRNIEWGTVLLGFEQANKYTVLDEEGETVALIAEDVRGFGDALGRQLLRTRRSFTATVFSADGSQVIFRIRRPAYLINSSMYVENGSGDVLGEIQQRWHLWKRNYDLYMNRDQFARIEGNFLAWEFELKDEKGGTLALIDRNFQGFGKEIFTDAGKYVIHFGESPVQAAETATRTLKARSDDANLPAVTPLAKLRTGVKVIPSVTGNQLIVAKRLELTQRMVALACAMTIDYDYFSRHSSGAGYLTPPIILPLPGGAETPAEASTADVPPATGETSAGQVGSEDGEALGDDDVWKADESEHLDSGEGGFLSGLFDNLDVFNDS